MSKFGRAALVVGCLAVAVELAVAAQAAGSPHHSLPVNRGNPDLLPPRVKPIDSIPGLNDTFDFEAYGGYINVNNTAGHRRDLYFSVFYSSRDAATDPVLLWLNGGPGCASDDGLWYEHGPFHFDLMSPPSDPVPILNPNTLNANATVIYLDAPAGVGFSTEEDASFVWNDDKYADDTYEFLLQFFGVAFPDLASNDFYITGESYAGVYVPVTAARVVDGNAAGNTPHINLVGVAAGNAVSDEICDGNSYIPFICSHFLLSFDTCAELERVCEGVYYPANAACTALQDKILGPNYYLPFINLYDLIFPCYGGFYEEAQKYAEERQLRAHRTHDRIRTRLHAANIERRLWESAEASPPADGSLEAIPGAGAAPSYTPVVPCISTQRAHVYLNRADVRGALGAANDSVVPEWVICSDQISNTYVSQYPTMYPFYEKLLAANVRVLIFTGDMGTGLSVFSGERFAYGFNRTQSTDWAVYTHYSSTFNATQAAGYHMAWADDALHYATVLGAGHMAAQFRPAATRAMMYNFISKSAWK